VLWLVDRPLGLKCLEYAAASGIGEMCGVVSNPDGGQAWWGTPTFQSWSDEHRVRWFDRSASGDAVQATSPDLLISVLFTDRLSAELVSTVRSVNLHCAPLPAYRGYNATLWAILNDERYFGATLHEMTAECDEGPIIDCGRFEVPAAVSNAELYAMAQEDGYELLRRNLERLVTHQYSTRPQDGTPRYYARRELPSRCIDPSLDPATIGRYARAFHFPPFEPAFFMIDGRKIYLTA
jgi:methionyl-tRNA formyltransferase